MYTPLHRMTILTTLSFALLASVMCGPALARLIDPPAEAPTSSLAGTTESQDLRNPDNRPAAPARQFASPDAFDAVGALEQWFDTGRAPARIVASGKTESAAARTRPLCPYPERPIYTGAGPMDRGYAPRARAPRWPIRCGPWGGRAMRPRPTRRVPMRRLRARARRRRWLDLHRHRAAMLLNNLFHKSQAQAG